MRLYFIALQFLTIIPLPFKVRCAAQDLGRSMALFPLVGVTIGLLLVGLDWLLTPLLPWSVVALLLIVALAIVTGALHLDGLADVCDGLAARGDKERFLAVMKDSRSGAVGVVGLVLGLLLKYQALLALPLEMRHSALLLFPMAARGGQVLITAGAGSARNDGLGVLFISGAGGVQLASAISMTLLLAWQLAGLKGIYATLGVLLLAWGVRSWSQRRLGGVTGDIIGCGSELGEICCLLIMLALARI